jgi:hypothetical protein
MWEFDPNEVDHLLDQIGVLIRVLILAHEFSPNQE